MRAQAVAPRRFRAALGKVLIVGGGEGAIEHGGKIARIVGRADRGLEGNGRARNQVVAADAFAPLAGDARRFVDSRSRR